MDFTASRSKRRMRGPPSIRADASRCHRIVAILQQTREEPILVALV